MTTHKILGDVTSIGIGYVSIPTGNGHLFNNMLDSIMPHLSQGAVDEIAKMVASLLLAVISRWIYAKLLDRKAKKAATVAPKDVPAPPENISLTQNQNDHGNTQEISK